MEEFGIAMAVVMLMVVLVNFMTLMMEAVVLRPMVFGSQVVLFGFAYLAYQKHTEVHYVIIQEVQLRCINSIEKYGCAPGMFKGLFIMYIVLGFIYLFKVSQDWSKVKMGCMNISKSS